MQSGQSTQKDHIRSSSLIFSGSVAFVRSFLFIVGGLLIGSGFLINQLYKDVFWPQEFYLTTGALIILLSLISFLIPHIRTNLQDYAFIILSLTYLGLIYMAYANLLGTYFVTVLIIGQILLCISFKNLAEYLIIAFVTLGLFIFSTLRMNNLETNPLLFIIIMSLATIMAGLYIWLRNSSVNKSRSGWEYESLLFDPASPEEINIAKALKQSEENYREIFNAGTEGIIIVHPENKEIIEVNEKITHITGYSPKEFKKLDFDSLMGEKSMNLSFLIDKALKEGSFEKEIEFVKKSSEIIPIALTSKLILLGGHFRVFLIINNIEERKVFEEKLDQYAELYESLDVGMVILKVFEKNDQLDFKISSTNAYASNALRMRADGLAGKNIDDVFPGLAGTGGKEKLIEAFKQNRIVRADEIQFHEIGSVDKFWQTKIVPLRGNLIGVLFEDDTERRENLDRLKLFRELINQSSDAIFVIDPLTGEMIDFNRTFAETLGFTPEEAKQLKARQLIESTGSRFFNGKSIADLRKFRSGIYQEKVKRKDGTLLSVEVNVALVNLLEKEFLIFVARDITERIHQEEALKESEQKYRTLVEKMNEGLVLTDNDETILFVNNRLGEILKRPKEELIGKKSYEVFLGEDSQKLIEDKFELRKKGISDQYEFKLQLRNGDYIWVLIAGAPFIDGNGDMIGTIAIITDITDRKIAEIKLKSKNQELDAFVYKASHDLKGPLASIIGITNIAKEEVKEEDSLHYFDLISKSTRRLDLILTELIDLTRINKAKLKLENVNINSLIDEIFSSLKHQPLSKGVSFYKEIQLSNGFISDKKLLTSIFQNLILNGIIYRQPEAPDSFVRFLAREWEDKVIFMVEDNGLGISEKIKERVFEMFYRGNAKSKGSGLGLYLVKNSVEKLHGTIDLESKQGDGTRFTISFPRVPKTTENE